MAPKTLARSRIHQPGWAHPAWYGAGTFSPVFYADGDPVAEPDDVPEGEPEPQAEPEDDWTPPTREEWEAHQAKLKTASGEAAARRKFLRANGIDPKTGNKLNPDPEPDTEPAADPKDTQPQGPSPAEVKRQVERAVAEAKVEGLRAAKEMVSNVNSVLEELGWNGQRLGLVMQLANLDGLDSDDKEGILEEFDRVKGIFPEGFTPLKRTRNPANPSNGAGGSGQNGVTPAKIDAADKKPPAPEPKDWVEKLARQATRGA
ncbi:hypothetical protein [Streptomyces liliifuscus]|uniref:Scaffolding protein n=1 Tax=Streptomyces liliifuscus TaxID=2797636 RepID=A0A7T7RFZ2_9ACTN|nr:hypothetical protein [Streptomyces liliifuscus]QQM45194.1 hypothetical protein JEQ17_41185 [Streptomyces liliifuscus]